MAFVFPDLGQLRAESLDYCASLKIDKAGDLAKLLDKGRKVTYGRCTDSSGVVFVRVYAGWLPDEDGTAHLHVDFARERLFKNPPPAQDATEAISQVELFRGLEASVELDAEFSVAISDLPKLGTIVPFLGIAVRSSTGHTLRMAGGTFSVVGKPTEVRTIKWRVRSTESSPVGFTVESAYSAQINDSYFSFGADVVTRGFRELVLEGMGEAVLQTGAAQ